MAASRDASSAAALSLISKRAVQITRWGGPEVMDIVDLPDPTPGDGEQLHEVSSAGVTFADTHHRLSRMAGQPRLLPLQHPGSSLQPSRQGEAETGH
jgi:hypothetical protein